MGKANFLVNLGAVLTLGFGHCFAQNRVNAAAIDSYIAPYVESANFSGCVLVEKDGKTVFEKAYGLADREANLSNRSNTRFHIASVSMQFTAAAILRLVDQKRISLDTKVSNVVPGITGGDKISVRDLLVERSGLADINELPDYSDVLKAPQTPASLVAKVKDRPLLFEPGSKFQHEEHSAYNLLALIVETKTGLPFAKAMEKLVFKPAGLAGSSVDDDHLSDRRVAKGYQPKGVSELEAAATIHWSAKSGNASVVATVQDEARWVQSLFNGTFLSKNSREEILSTSPPVGYGWFRRESSRFHETAYYMNGRAPGFASFVLYLPKERLTVVVFSNIYSSATTTMGNDVGAISMGLPFEPFRPSSEDMSAAQLASSVGSFKFGPDFYQANAEVQVVAEGKELSLRWPSGELSPLIQMDRDRFVDRAYWEPVIIERDANDKPTQLSYDRFKGAVIPSD